jgi:hypothetical protein
MTYLCFAIAKNMHVTHQIVMAVRIKKINRANAPISSVNTFEVAVLRVLVKRHAPLKLSMLVSGFPDDCEDGVLAAVSSLKLAGYIVLSDYQPNGNVSIAREKRQEILQIVDSDIYPHKVDVPIANEKKSSSRAKYQPQIRAAAIASLVVLGLFAIVVPALPATSTDTEFVAHHHSFQSHWYAYGAGNDGDMPASHPHVSQMSAALADCSQKQQS